MGQLKVEPYSGINKRYPIHKLVGKKKQYLVEALNYLILDNRIKTYPGATKYNSSNLEGTATWGDRIYYTEASGDKKRYQFSVIGRKMYRLDEGASVLDQVTIDGSNEIQLEDNIYPHSFTVKSSGNIAKFLVDGKYIYKFIGNEAGNWERLPVKTDIDGNTIKPVHGVEYLDRVWLLDKERNVLIGSANTKPEEYNSATDSVLLQLPPGNGGFAKALVLFRGLLYIWHEDYFVPLSGTSASTFGVRPSDVIYGYGTHAQRSIIVTKNAMGFLNAEDNEYYLTGGNLDATLKTPLSYDIKLSKLMNPYQESKTVCHLDTQLNSIRISYVPTGEDELNKEAIYSIDEEKWCGETYGRKISFYSQWDGADDDGQLVTGRDDVGNLMRDGIGFNFDGNAQRYRLVTAAYLAEGDDEEVIFEHFYIDGKSFGEGTTMPLAYYLDGRITTSGSEAITMQGEITVLGHINIQEQTIFTDRILPLIDKDRGKMIQFVSDETVKDTSREIYGIYANYNKTNKKYSKTIVGV